MSPLWHPESQRLRFLAAVPWVLGLAAAAQTWAVVDNVMDHGWILAGGFALSTLAFVALTALFLRLRCRAGRSARSSAPTART